MKRGERTARAMKLRKERVMMPAALMYIGSAREATRTSLCSLTRISSD